MRITENQLRRVIRRAIIEEKKGLWDNVHAKRAEGRPPAKPGDDGYPDEEAWKSAQEGDDDDDERLDEAEYQGRKVELNKKMQGDTKKSKVYVKGCLKDKDAVKKIEFGEKGARIKKDNPDARKSFRARHKCDTEATKNDKCSARHWSCKSW